MAGAHLARGCSAPLLLATGPVEAGFVLTPDGLHAVFSTPSALQSVALDGSAPPLTLDGPARELVITPAGLTVLYRSLSSRTVRRTFVTEAQPVDVTSSDWPWKLTPDGLGVVGCTYFGPDLETGEAYAGLHHVTLFTSAVLGQTEWFGSPFLPPEFLVTSARAIYVQSPHQTGIASELRSSPYGGGSSVVLGTVSSPAREYRVTAGGDRVVFLDATERLVAIASDGSGPAVDLSVPPADGVVTRFEPTDDGQHVVFVTGGELHAVPVDASAAPRLLSLAGSVVEDFTLVPDGSGVAYASAGDLYSVPLDRDREPLLLSASAVAADAIAAMVVSVDGASVVYAADHLVDERVELFRAPFDGGAAPVRLNADLPPGVGLDPARFTIAPGGAQVVYAGAQDFPGVDELFATPIDVGMPVQLSDEPATGIAPREVRDFDLVAGGNRVVYRANAEDEETDELFLGGSGIRLSGVIEADWSVTDWHPSRDGSRLAFTTEKDPALPFEAPRLWCAPSDGSTPPVAVAEGHLVEHALDPSGQYVVYTTGVFDGDLLRVPASGGAPLDLAPGLFVAGGGSPGFVITPDGASVLFRVSAPAAERGLHFVPLDGGAAPHRLHPLDPQTSSGAAVAPDSSRVVFEALGLWSAPISVGTTTGTLLSSQPVGAQPGFSYRISPDSQTVVFASDLSGTGRIDLHRRPIDASAPALKLNGAMPNNRAVREFAITADSSAVVYLANSSFLTVDELFSVPLDGSAAPVRLNAALPAGGDVVAFELASDSHHVVFRADGIVNERFELFVATIGVSSTPTLLSGTIPAQSDVRDFQVTDDAKWVVYLCDAVTAGVVELFVVPLDGSAAPRRVSAPLVEGGDVDSFRLASIGNRAFYLADQRFDGWRELFVAPLDALGGATRPATSPTRTVTRSF